MSDSLPFTPYDSMEYATVQDAPVPKGFVGRDQAGEMQQKELQKTKQVGPPEKEQVPMQPRPTLAKEDVDIGPPKGSSKPDIGNYKNVYDLVYILIAVLIVDVAVIFLVRYSPEIFGQVLNRWYTSFGLNAVIADVGILFLGFVIARYVYTLYIKDKFAEGKWCPFKFVGTVVGVQLIHDLLFYYGIILQVPRGHNAMIDTFKDYAAGGSKILAGDAIMMIASAGIAMLLKAQPTHIVSSIGALVTYAVPYILYTKNQYT